MSCDFQLGPCKIKNVSCLAEFDQLPISAAESGYVSEKLFFLFLDVRFVAFSILLCPSFQVVFNCIWFG